jgi:selenocysteine lyase/cysteine desulfurase
VTAIDELRRAFRGGTGYLNTTHHGLLPDVAVERLQTAARALGDGSFDTRARDAAVASARGHFARLMGVAATHVATGPSVSVFVGLVVSSLPDGSTVLIVEDDFTSLTLPIVVQRDRLNVVAVDAARLIDAIDHTIDVVAVSAVQSSDGAVMDLRAMAQKRRDLGITVLLDVTQAAGWLPIAAREHDVVVAAAYKWLLCPRGVAFACFNERMIAATRPILAGWYAAEDIASGYYGTNVELSSTARRFDLSPSGINWLGAEPALALLTGCDIDDIRAHDVGLANRFRTGLDEPGSNSPIVSLPASDDAVRRLRSQGIRFGLQAGRRRGHARFAFHIYNTVDDVDAAVTCMR